MALPLHGANAKRTKSNSPDEDEGKRPRMDGSIHDDKDNVPEIDMVNSQGVECIYQQASHSLELLHDSTALSDFLEAGTEEGVAGFGEKDRQIHQKQAELNQIFTKFMKDLDDKYKEIENVMGEATDMIGSHERWWELMNIFSPNFDCKILRDLQERSVPTTVDYADYIRKNMYVIWDSIDFDNNQIEWFYEFLEEEIHRVFDMNNDADTWIAAAQLAITAKLDILQSPTQTIIDSFTLLEHHEKYDRFLREMMTERFDELRYVNAADACRRVRERMNRHACTASRDAKCVFNTLLPTLEILQTRAKYEIRHAVMQATGTKLPAELADLVLEYTLAAEQVPSDPRIFVLAKRKGLGVPRRKARLVCEHLRKAGHAFVEERQAWVWEPRWIEIE